MKKRTGINIFLYICSILICFIVGEIIIRTFGHCDIDGNFYFLSIRLRPYKLPVLATKKKIDGYFSLAISYITYDSLLGWSNKPRGTSDDGNYLNNADGIRTASRDTQISKTSPAGGLRIAIFGDSCTYGSGMPFENTWGYYLEDNLKKSGIEAEVLNFGVAGYGMDQAFLRWKELGYKFSPHIVIFGFDSENMKRNLNLIRTILYPEAGFPFSKPRYIIEGNGLKLINSPVIPLENVTAVMKNMQAWDLAKYEYWYNPKDYLQRPWRKSKLLSAILDSIIKLKRRLTFYSLVGEPSRVSLKIIQAFKKDVEAKGAKFYIVHLPEKARLNRLLHLPWYKLPYSELLKRLEEVASVIHPENRMLDEAKHSTLEALFADHYSATSNRLIAEVITEFILKQQNK